jgi:head-tail adaptor
MRAGAMRHPITIESATETHGSDGSVIQTWHTFATVWASIEPLVGKEYFAAERSRRPSRSTSGHWGKPR